MLDLRPDLVRHAMRIAFCSPCPSVGDECFLRRAEWLIGFIGIFVAEFIERKAATRGDVQTSGDRFLVTGIEPEDFGGALQMPLGIGLQSVAGCPDRAFFADTS